MPLQNRVTPDGDIVAVAARGLMMGNRGGCFHTPDGHLRRRRWASKQWICCVLSFKGRRRRLMQPGLYTELFFLDEATAMAAGHRPCFECRRQDSLRFARLWAGGESPETRARAPAMDGVLHAQRVDAAGQKITHAAAWSTLPDGTVVRLQEGPHLVLASRLLAWTADGYGIARARPRKGVASILTPPAMVAVMAAGYRPGLHPTAVRGREAT